MICSADDRCCFAGIQQTWLCGCSVGMSVCLFLLFWFCKALMSTCVCFSFDSTSMTLVASLICVLFAAGYGVLSNVWLWGQQPAAGMNRHWVESRDELIVFLFGVVLRGGDATPCSHAEVLVFSILRCKSLSFCFRFHVEHVGAKSLGVRSPNVSESRDA